MTPELAARDTHSASAENPLHAAAAPLLNAIVQIRLAATHDDPAGLRHQLIEEIRQFEARCKQRDLPFEMIIGTRYCLCSVLDEAAAQTPWGTRGVWSGNGLLVTFHNESWGGEKFFQLLSRISQSPQQHLWLLEVIHYCLLLGYEGRYRGAANGRAQCEAIRVRLAQLIDTTRNTPPTPPASQVIVRPQQSTLWRPPVPLWACIAVTAFLACMIYSALNWRLGNAAEPLLRAIYQIPLPQVKNSRNFSSPQRLLDLRKPLSDVIAAGQLDVSDGPFGSKVMLSSDKLFDNAATALNPVGRALITRVAAAMSEIKGNVVVTVYTDNQPLHSARFASNYEYSLAQARTITALLRQQLATGHSIRAEGRGDSAALYPNDSQENRARNRRVEITLFAAPESASTVNKGTP
ncbi:type IVB secretion system protein IcmH/DotU [Winslowiella iniecta]|uniref:Membrane protein n=1 Tax=Winslowiella iniecta TaxID=1560201 RepID=A0A0L7TI42_9GAMM|nr:type IVB secretion system protein IcmH/DotU [Winslowiella iniecta]KOC91967.1 membrane protein [Winslowiella iniecta]KOC94911.1 membrane protein [Winslowiella iniecta]